VNGYESFAVPACNDCGGIYKPDVVMFGESVPKDRVRKSTDAIDRADALMVIGSSLMVFSGFRFVQQAREQRKPIVIINKGRTRADDIATFKVDGDCAQTLSAALGRLR
jgi:NAD-dependent SIR2 family protein deacetylase